MSDLESCYLAAAQAILHRARLQQGFKQPLYPLDTRITFGD